jgi:NAD(P)-dependent dehydrogenase (short-subunit alcohol dehydrogenase family)
MAAFDSPAITPGSTVLVTGANGFVGAHVADQLLQQGYIVRGTVRDAAKHQWLADLFSQKYGKDRFEIVTVKDMREPGAFDNAVSGILPAMISYCSNTDEVPLFRRFRYRARCLGAEHGRYTRRVDQDYRGRDTELPRGRG